MKEPLLFALGLLFGLMIGAFSTNMSYTHNSVLTTTKPFIIDGKTYICREQIVSYKDINQNN